MPPQQRSTHLIRSLVESSGAGPWRRCDLLALGWSPARIRAQVANGHLVQVQHGRYALAGAEGTRQVRIRAALSSAGPTAVVSHETAAEEQELWIPRPSPLVHLTEPGSSERTDHGMKIHGSRLPSDFVTEVDGLPMTTVARTAMDVARGKTLPQALVVMDSAGRRIAERHGVPPAQLRDPAVRARIMGPVSRELGHAFDSIRTWPGSVVARGAVELVDLGSESPWESLSRGWIIEARLPLPLTCYQVHGLSGAVYYADFAWPELRLLGEVDGFAKYGADEPTQQARLRDERLRQDDLQDAGWRFVRWSTADRRRQAIQRISRALKGPE